jgi:hypothetical protein
MGSICRRLVRRFPYAILYATRPGVVRVLAVMNLKRRPTYWVGMAISRGSGARCARFLKQGVNDADPLRVG